MNKSIIACCLALALTVLKGRAIAQDGRPTDNAGHVTNPSVPVGHCLCAAVGHMWWVTL